MTESPDNIARYLMEAHDMVFICDSSRKIIYLNNSAQEELGFPERFLTGRDLLGGVEEHSRSLAEDLFNQTLSNTGWHGEILLQRSDGHVFPAYVSASPITGDNGNVVKVLVIAHDISQRKLLEEDIRKRAELASSIIRTAPIGIFSLDINRNFKAVNSAFSEMIDIKGPAHLLEKPFTKISGRLNPELSEAVDTCFEGRETLVINQPLRSGGPEDLIVSLIAIPLRDPEGRVEGAVALVENRTELVKVEEQMLQADKLASTGFLAAGIAHEIRNPLTGIRTVIDVLAKRARREGQEDELYQRIIENIARIEVIIRRTLEFANPARIQPQKSDLNALVMQVLDFFKFHPIFRKINFVWNLSPDLPEIIVDPKQIQQIFHNLAMNAAQAMKGTGGSLTISSGLVKSTTGSDFMEMTIRDSGPGIPDNSLKRIFDPFYTTKPPGEGTGLGLSVSYSIAKNHGGDLRARNHPDGGAEFLLRIPVSRD